MRAKDMYVSATVSSGGDVLRIVGIGVPTRGGARIGMGAEQVRTGVCGGVESGIVVIVNVERETMVGYAMCR